MKKKDLSKQLIFNNNPKEFISEDAVNVIIPKNILRKDELLKILDINLKFPYFGGNWDALWDLLNDFCWIEKKKIIFIHEDLPLKNDLKNLNIYLELITDAKIFWKSYEDHELIIVFPEDQKSKIKNLIR